MPFLLEAIFPGFNENRKKGLFFLHLQTYLNLPHLSFISLHACSCRSQRHKGLRWSQRVSGEFLHSKGSEHRMCKITGSLLSVHCLLAVPGLQHQAGQSFTDNPEALHKRWHLVWVSEPPYAILTVRGCFVAPPQFFFKRRYSFPSKVSLCFDVYSDYFNINKWAFFPFTVLCIAEINSRRR